MPNLMRLWAWVRCWREKAARSAFHWPWASSASLTLSLAIRRAKDGFVAIRRAMAIVYSCSSSRGTMWFTIPAALASSAVSQSLVNSSSLALRGPSSHGWAKYSTPFTPMPTVGSTN